MNPLVFSFLYEFIVVYVQVYHALVISSDFILLCLHERVKLIKIVYFPFTKSTLEVIRFLDPTKESN